MLCGHSGVPGPALSPFNGWSFVAHAHSSPSGLLLRFP